MTVGELRKLLEGLSDDVPVLIREPNPRGTWEEALEADLSTASRLGPIGWHVAMDDEDEEPVLLIHS